MNREQMIQRQQELLNTARAAQRELTAEEPGWSLTAAEIY